MFKKAIKKQEAEEVTLVETDEDVSEEEEVEGDPSDENTVVEEANSVEVIESAVAKAVAQEKERILSILDAAKVENKVAISAIKNGLSIEVASEILEASNSVSPSNNFDKAVEASEVEVSVEDVPETDSFMEMYRTCRNS